MSALSVGDVLAISTLVKDLAIALNDTRGSAAEYRSIINELLLLDNALLHVAELFCSNEPTPELEALHKTAEDTVRKCRESMRSFQNQLDKYDGCLGSSISNGNG